MKRWLLATVLVVGLLAGACGEDFATTPGATSPAPTSTIGALAAGETPAPTVAQPTAAGTGKGVTVTSSIKNFTHQSLKIAVGTTVKWEHEDGVPHTTTSGVPEDSYVGVLWNSDRLKRGDSFPHTFTEVGTFQYFCRVHPTVMQGTITVVEKLDGPPTTPTGADDSPGGIQYEY